LSTQTTAILYVIKMGTPVTRCYRRTGRVRTGPTDKEHVYESPPDELKDGPKTIFVFRDWDGELRVDESLVDKQPAPPLPPNYWGKNPDDWGKDGHWW
jgi:hypothetical protein